MRVTYKKKEIPEKFFKAGTEALWVFGGQLGVAAGSLLRIKILTQILTPQEYGRFSLAATMILIIGITFFSPLGQGLTRYCSIARERGQLEAFVCASDRFVAVLIRLIFFMAVITTVILMLTPWKEWALLTGLSIIAGGIAGGGDTRIFVVSAVRKRKIVAILNTLKTFAKPCIGAVIAVAFILNAEAVVAGYALAAVMLFFIIERVYRNIVTRVENTPASGNKEFKKQTGPIGREILAFSWPFFLWGIFSWIHQFCDRWSIMAYHGADVVGAFSVIGQLAVYPLLFGANFLSSFFMPIAYERAGDPASAKSLKPANTVLFTMTGIYFIGAGSLISLFALFHKEIVLLVSNHNYTAFSYLLPWLTLAWAFYYSGQMLSAFGLMANKPGFYVAPVIISGISAAALTFYLSSALGPPGVVAGLGIAGCIYASWCMVIGLKLLK